MAVDEDEKTDKNNTCIFIFLNMGDIIHLHHPEEPDETTDDKVLINNVFYRFSNLLTGRKNPEGHDLRFLRIDMSLNGHRLKKQVIDQNQFSQCLTIVGRYYTEDLFLQWENAKAEDFENKPEFYMAVLTELRRRVGREEIRNF